jgi:hypothetical protein
MTATGKFTRHLPEIKHLITQEFPIATFSFDIAKIKNQRLKNYLEELNVSKVSVNYTNRNPSNSLMRLNDKFLMPEMDSTITLCWNRSTDAHMITESLFYFFAELKPSHTPLNANDLKERRINDSIWVQKSVADIVIVY